MKKGALSLYITSGVNEKKGGENSVGDRNTTFHLASTT